ncbi:MAG: DUF4831 family protein [Bacteroidales bacterium]|jgi:hypothetical protein|nr:DUF4831 family protein [Bacteroidales bacterium]
MKKILCIGILIVLAGSVFGQSRVIKLPANKDFKAKNSTFTYQLPQTAFRITVTAIRKDAVPGVYAEWADKLLNLKNIIRNNGMNWTLKQLSIEPCIVADNAQSYLVELSKNQEQNGFLETLPATCLIENRQPSFGVYQVQTITVPAFFRNFANVSYENVEEIYTETQIVDSVLTYIPVSKTKTVSKSIEMQAREAADFITKIRNDRYALLAGSQEVPYSKEVMAYMLGKLDTLESNYLKLFTGYVLENEYIYTFTVFPETNAGKSFIFAIDKERGVLENEKNGAENYYLEYKLPKDIIAPNNEIQNQGYCFRKAMPVDVILSTDKQSLQKLGCYDIYQFSPVQQFPANRDRFEIGHYIIFHH